MPDGGLDPQELKQSIEAVNLAFSEFKQKNDERLKEIEKKDAADPLLTEQLDKINKAMDLHQEAIDATNARLKRLAIEAPTEGGENCPEKKAQDWAEFAANSFGAPRVSDYSAEALGEYSTHLKRYLRRGEKAFGSDEFKALAVGGDPDGGYVVTPDTSGRIVSRIYETSPIRQYAAVQSTSSDSFEGMYDLDEVDFGWTTEKGARTETSTPQLDVWRIPVHEMYAEPRATQKILDDASIDIEGWLQNKVADKFARAEASAFINGDGVGKPRGFLTYSDRTSPGVYQLGALERFGTGASGDFAATPDASDVFIDALYSLKPQYRANAVWALNRATTGAVRKLKNSDGDYIWAPGMQQGQPASILNHSMASFEDMPDIGANSLSIAIGDFGAGYQIVDRIGIRVLRDPYTAKPFIKYYSTKRVGGDVIDFDAIKLIEFA